MKPRYENYSSTSGDNSLMKTSFGDNGQNERLLGQDSTASNKRKSGLLASNGKGAQVQTKVSKSTDFAAEKAGINMDLVAKMYVSTKIKEEIVQPDGSKKMQIARSPLSKLSQSPLIGFTPNHNTAGTSDSLVGKSLSKLGNKEEWMPDKDVTNCIGCSRKFTLWYRKHHCRLCHRIFCSDCSSVTMSKYNKEVANMRFCKECELNKKKLNEEQNRSKKILNAEKFQSDYRKTDEDANKKKYLKESARFGGVDENPYYADSSLIGGKNQEDNEDPDQFVYYERQKLSRIKKKEGIQGASKHLANMSNMLQTQIEAEKKNLNEGFLGRRHSTILSKRSVSGLKDSALSDSDVQSYQEDSEGHEDFEETLEECMNDIRTRVMNEFQIDKEKWGSMLADLVTRAIKTVQPSSFVFKDSIDITKYIKIQLIHYKDTSKSKYLNGVVVNKSIAHKRMESQIKNPRILLIQNSLGNIKDEMEFMDLEAEIKQEDSFIQIIMKKIDTVKPNLIFVQNDTSMKAIEALLEKNITLVNNVKESVMKRIARMTMTIPCPSTNLLNPDFKLGKCAEFSWESLAIKNNKRMIENVSTNLIQLDGCLNFLGCTLLLSGPDMTELKLVKHALKKMLRMSRQLILESEYYTFFDLMPIKSPSAQTLRLSQELNLNVNPLINSLFLHKKHVERNFLIFKEITYSIRDKQSLQETKDNEDNHPDDDKELVTKKDMQSEKEVQARINMVCQAAKTQNVHFYNENKEDISLISQLRLLSLKATQVCKMDFCHRQFINHTYQYYHGNGYVEMRLRVSKDVSQTIKNDEMTTIMKQSQNKPIYILAQCEKCKRNVFSKKQMNKQLQELSFYSFLEQFFYNTDNLKLNQSEKLPEETCPHSFHAHCKIVFLIDILRIEFMYYPVDIYQLDLVCFKDLKGIMPEEKALANFYFKKADLISQLDETFDFISASIRDFQTWVQEIKLLDYLTKEAKTILQNITNFLDIIDQNSQTYKERAFDCLEKFKANNEFYLNKMQKAITSRVADYLHILKSLYSQIFDELVSIMQKELKKQSNKRDNFFTLSQHLGFNFQGIGAQAMVTQQTLNHQKGSLAVRTSTQYNNQIKKHNTMLIDQDDDSQARKESNFDEDQLPVISIPEIMQGMREEHKTFHAGNQNYDYIEKIMTTDHIFTFEDRLKTNPKIKALMKMSPSIQNGFNMDCTIVDESDLSSIITQAILSNEYMMGLREQNYMGLQQKFENKKHVFKSKESQNQRNTVAPFQEVNKASIVSNLTNATNFRNTTRDRRNSETEFWKKDLEQQFIGAKSSHMLEDFYLLKEECNVFNQEISMKEIETELLRLDHNHFSIDFNSYKAPQTNGELTIIKDGGKKVLKVDKGVLQSTQSLEDLDPLMPCDIDKSYYQHFNDLIIQQILSLKISRAKDQKLQDNIQLKLVSQNDKYSIYTLFHAKAEIGIKIYFPSHFEALRKLYCGSYDSQNMSMFKSVNWTDNSGGKSQSKFYKSCDEKLVLKVIKQSEMNMFNGFALSYFEYMCRSFSQMCPTSISKILGAYKIKIRTGDKRNTTNTTAYVIMMENLTCGIDPKKVNLIKYDLKGSMMRRYIDFQGNTSVTRLDTNLLEDMNSKPICMNYTLNRLMQIAIHNDTSFLSRHEKIDYSMLVWIDKEMKLIRVGIIDYIQYYSPYKQIEHMYKSTLANHNGLGPTIVNPQSYKDRFQKAMYRYFLGILSDQQCETFEQIVTKQMKLKQENLEPRPPVQPSSVKRKLEKISEEKDDSSFEEVNKVED